MAGQSGHITYNCDTDTELLNGYVDLRESGSVSLMIIDVTRIIILNRELDPHLK